MIGNTDRHSENWGFLVDVPTVGDPRYRLAPAFDNGTSLGFLIRENDLGKFTEARRLSKFIADGKHHFGWLSGNAASAQHVALCRQYVSVYGAPGAAMRDVIQLSDSRIESVVAWASRFDFPERFSQARANFVFAQVKARRDALIAAIGA